MGGHANLLIKPQISNTFTVVNWFVLFWVQGRRHGWPGQLPPNIVFASHCLSSSPSLSPWTMSRASWFSSETLALYIINHLLTYLLNWPLHELSLHPSVPSAPPCRRQATIEQVQIVLNRWQHGLTMTRSLGSSSPVFERKRMQAWRAHRKYY